LGALLSVAIPVATGMYGTDVQRGFAAFFGVR
jgi:hypothetical protein